MVAVPCSARLDELRQKLEAAQAEHDRLASIVDKLRGDVQSALSLLDGLKKQAQPDQKYAPDVSQVSLPVVSVGVIAVLVLCAE